MKKVLQISCKWLIKLWLVPKVICWFILTCLVLVGIFKLPFEGTGNIPSKELEALPYWVVCCAFGWIGLLGLSACVEKIGKDKPLTSKNNLSLALGSVAIMIFWAYPLWSDGERNWIQIGLFGGDCILLALVFHGIYAYQQNWFSYLRSRA
jgi:hypothetical protein